MKINKLIVFFVLSVASQLISLNTDAQIKNEYLIVASNSVKSDSCWNKIVIALEKKHIAKTVYFNSHPKEVFTEIQKIEPRYLAIVDKPENINVSYVIDINRMVRKIDDDIFSDCIWGIISGYNAEYALKMVTNSIGNFIVKTALNTTGESSAGNLYERFAWLDDGKKYMWGEKSSPHATIVKHDVDEWSYLKIFVNQYEAIDPDLIISSSHATEETLEMPFSTGDIKCRNGRLYADFCESYYLPVRKKPRVYIAAGNCLIGNMNNSKESMAAAWISSGGATSMIGYVVPTWYGRAGWGALKYWISNPGKFTLAQANYLNQQEMLHILNEWDPRFNLIEPDFETEMYKNEVTSAAEKVLGRKISKDECGFLHDRDVLNFYGDPAWDARVKDENKKPGYTVDFKKSGNNFSIIIKFDKNLDSGALKGRGIKQIHVNDIPFAYFFPERIKNPELVDPQNLEVILDDNFIMIYNLDFTPGKVYKIVIKSLIKK